MSKSAHSRDDMLSAGDEFGKVILRGSSNFPLQQAIREIFSGQFTGNAERKVPLAVVIRIRARAKNKPAANFNPPIFNGYRGRLAPSPTGHMHVGHARTFWTAYQRVRDAGGTLVFRNEDLDRTRSREDFAASILEDLRWLGIRWQEGPDVGGPCQPYRQSERHSHYLAAWLKLFRAGIIYPCRCSRKDLALTQQAPHETYSGLETPGVVVHDDEAVYPGTCRNTTLPFYQLPDHKSAHPFPGGFNWRFRVTEGEVVEFEDQHFGKQRFVAGQDFGDFLVWRRDDVASYQLASVVDDGAMGITEVVRGADLLKSTARQVLLQRALGLPHPKWYHCPLVTDQNGERVAKRHAALALRTLRNRGITPLAVLSTALPFES